jgi:hypothetical protein
MRAVQRFGRNIIAYTPTQKLLHWTTAVLVLLQWWTSSEVLRTHQLHRSGNGQTLAIFFCTSCMFTAVSLSSAWSARGSS